MRDLRFYSPLSGVGGEGGAYIDRTVDKVSFVIFVMKSVASLSVVRQNHALSKVILNLFKTFKLGNKIK